MMLKVISSTELISEVHKNIFSSFWKPIAEMNEYMRGDLKQFL